MEETLDHVNGLLINHTSKPEAPIGTSTLGHGVSPDWFDTLDDLQLPMPSRKRRLEDEEWTPGVLGLPPNYLASMERMSIVVPFDWECQAGTSGGVYPCPMGVPSTCRANTGRLSAACAKCACTSDVSAGHACCQYHNGDAYTANGYDYSAFTCPAALQTGAWSYDYYGSYDYSFPDYSYAYGSNLLVGTTVNVCEVDEPVHAVWENGLIYEATVKSISSSKITVKFSDGDTARYDLLAEGYVSQIANGGDCVQTCDPAIVASHLWGPQWWNDPYVSTSYVNFKVTRYEMADSFGVEFYSTEGDTVKVFSTGDVHFKPQDAERTIYINEEAEYDYSGDDDRRLAGAASALGDIDLTLPIDTATLAEARRRHHTGLPADVATDADAGAKGAAKRPMDLARSQRVDTQSGFSQAKTHLEGRRRRLAGRRGGFLSTTGSFMLSSGSNTAGND